jgi:hypothetical protein
MKTQKKFFCNFTGKLNWKNCKLMTLSQMKNTVNTIFIFYKSLNLQLYNISLSTNLLEFFYYKRLSFTIQIAARLDLTESQAKDELKNLYHKFLSRE